MANRKKDLYHTFFDEISYTFKKRLDELGITMYAFCRDNKLNRATFWRILRGQCSFSLNTLIEYLDAAGLELKITKKNERTN